MSAGDLEDGEIADMDFGQSEPEEVKKTPSQKEKDREGEEADDEGSRRPCRVYNTRRGCDRGDFCRFSHEKQTCAIFNSVSGCKKNNCMFLHAKSRSAVKPVRSCPNCKEPCIGKQCSRCHRRMKNHKTEQRRAPLYRRSSSAQYLGRQLSCPHCNGLMLV